MHIKDIMQSILESGKWFGDTIGNLLFTLANINQ